MSERFYCPTIPETGVFRLEGEEAHHLSRVCRIEPGAIVEVFDGRGGGWRARVVAVSKKHVELEVVESLGESRKQLIDVTLAVAMPKGERLEWLVEKATELGVSRLMPVRFARSVVDPRSTKLERLRRKVIEASKQCRRMELMELTDTVNLEDYLGQEMARIRLVADPGGESFGAIAELVPSEKVSVIIGPEGGLTAEEVERCVARGWCRLGLGPTILRVETAALAVAAGLLARVVVAGSDDVLEAD